MDLLFQVIFPFVNFFIFLALLFWFAKKPAKNYALKKEKDYQDEKEKSLTAYQKASKSLDEVSMRLEKIDTELTLMRQESQKTSRRKVKEIEEKTKRQIDQLEKEALWFIDSAASKAKKELNQEFLRSIRAQMVEKVKEVDERQHQALLGQAEGQLKKLVAG